MVVATIIWALGFCILVAVYFLLDSGPSIEEGVFLVVVIVLFAAGVFFSQRNERLKTALEFPLFPNT